MDELRLFVDDHDGYSYSYSKSVEVICCRICHEAEFESSKPFEAPCSCSGTVKFAHRDCIQRWCDEKGNTICEICLQNFEPGYSSPTPANPVQLIHGETLQVPVRGVGPIIVVQQERLHDTEYAECSTTADTSASICRFLGLVFTIFLLVRHMHAILIGGTGDYPFTLLTLLIMRASGILLPMYIIMRTVDAIHKSIKSHGCYVFENDDDEMQHHTVDIEI